MSTKIISSQTITDTTLPASSKTSTISDAIATVSAKQHSAKWISNRSYAGRLLAANLNTRPIRFRPGSIGDGLPRRDLLVSSKTASMRREWKAGCNWKQSGSDWRSWQTLGWPQPGVALAGLSEPSQIFEGEPSKFAPWHQTPCFQVFPATKS